MTFKACSIQYTVCNAICVFVACKMCSCHDSVSYTTTPKSLTEWATVIGEPLRSHACQGLLELKWTIQVLGKEIVSCHSLVHAAIASEYNCGVLCKLFKEKRK